MDWWTLLEYDDGRSWQILADKSRPIVEGLVTPVTLDRASDVPIYRQIVRQIREGVRIGSLRRNERLPPTRALAVTLGINRLTVAKAYAELAKAGLITSHVGRGTFIDPEVPRPVGSGSTSARVPASKPTDMKLAWGSLFSRSTERALEAGPPPAAQGNAAPGVISFASLFPDPALFPADSFRKALDRVLRTQGRRILGYGPPAGNHALREMIAGGLRKVGMDVATDEIVITTGSQQGIDLVARALLDPGDVVLVENPTYTGAVQVFECYGAAIICIPIDEEGVVVPQLEEAVDRHRPKLIYLMPNFQNPTSATMTLKRRYHLRDLAARHRLAVLEDDFGGDLVYEGPSLPSLKSLDRGDNVVYLSTFAKKFLPGLRIGWIAAPRPLASRLIGLKKITDYSTSVLLQVALHEFCRRGDLDRHLAKVVERYRGRRDSMISAMKKHFPSEAAWTRPRGGLVIWVTLPDGVAAREVADSAEKRGILVGRGDIFYVNGGNQQHLRLTFSQASKREIHRGIRILGETIKQEMRTGRLAQKREATETLPLI